MLRVYTDCNSTAFLILIALVIPKMCLGHQVFEYLAQGLIVWFVGFFPLAEIYVAIPSAMALGLDKLSIFFWAVSGNFTPVIVVNALFQTMRSYQRVDDWLNRFASERVKKYVNQYGVWFVLFGTPWTGVWVMSVTAKSLGMSSDRLLIFSIISLCVYTVIIFVLIDFGVNLL